MVADFDVNITLLFSVATDNYVKRKGAVIKREGANANFCVI